MYAEILPDAVSILKPKLNEGMVAVIKKFLVERAKTRFKAVGAPYMIKMNRLTDINKIDTYPPTFPKYTFRLTPFHKLNEYVNVDEKFPGMHLLHLKSFNFGIINTHTKKTA